MKSIKPGRGPSAMGAVGGIAAGIFGIFWIISAAKMGAPITFLGFGVIFIIVAIAGVVYNLANATGKNRMSLYDITEEEKDPLDRWTREELNKRKDNKGENPYCPYCGKPAQKDHQYCSGCGKRL